MGIIKQCVQNFNAYLKDNLELIFTIKSIDKTSIILQDIAYVPISFYVN